MNWGVLGCAAIAKRSIIPAILSIEQNKLIAVASRFKNTAGEFARQFNCLPVEGYDELLLRDDIDAVYIPLPTGMHYEWVIKALGQNKHVLVEKSASTTLAEAEEMVALAKSKNLALVENFQFQHHSQHQYVFNLLRNSEIGEIRGFRSSFGFPPFDVANNIRYDKALGGGALLDAGAYVLKATTFLFGDGFKVEAAQLSMHDAFKVDWFGGAFLADRENGLFSEVAFGFDNYYQCNYEIWGSKGKITSNRAFTANVGFTPTVTLEKNGIQEEVTLEADDHFANILSYFNNLVAEKDFAKEWHNIQVQARLIEDVRLKGIK
jgi:dTDP-3,4-didehydro-2,6-dideoxy-alpha-D-glucose 3-reductase